MEYPDSQLDGETFNVNYFGDVSDSAIICQPLPGGCLDTDIAKVVRAMRLQN